MSKHISSSSPSGKTNCTLTSCGISERDGVELRTDRDPQSAGPRLHGPRFGHGVLARRRSGRRDGEDRLARRRAAAARLLGHAEGGYIENLDYERGNDRLTLTITAGDDRLTLILSGLIRCKWNYEKIDNAISGIRLSIEDTYLLLTIDGAEAEILTTHIEID